MAEKDESVNTLIKKKKLNELLKEEGIKRIERGVFFLIEKRILEELKLLAKKLKEDMEINGSRVLTKKIVKDTFEELDKEEEIEY